MRRYRRSDPGTYALVDVHPTRPASIIVTVVGRNGTPIVNRGITLSAECENTYLKNGFWIREDEDVSMRLPEGF